MESLTEKQSLSKNSSGKEKSVSVSIFTMKINSCFGYYWEAIKNYEVINVKR